MGLVVCSAGFDQQARSICDCQLPEVDYHQVARTLCEPLALGVCEGPCGSHLLPGQIYLLRCDSQIQTRRSHLGHNAVAQATFPCL